MLGLISTTPEATTSVWPSGTARAAAVSPILPLAPGRFSTTTPWPSTGASSAAISRPSRSLAPPGGKCTMMVIGRSGHAPYAGAAAIAIRPSANATPRHDGILGLPLAILSPPPRTDFHRLKHVGSTPQSVSSAYMHARPAA